MSSPGIQRATTVAAAACRPVLDDQDFEGVSGRILAQGSGEPSEMAVVVHALSKADLIDRDCEQFHRIHGGG